MRVGDEMRAAVLDGERSHASDLLQDLDRLAVELGIERRDGVLVCNAVVAGTGPGSYTGLRVGVATALGIARATGGLLRGVPSVEALAYDAIEVGQIGAVALDARANRFYFALYERTESDVTALVPPSTVSAKELRAALEAADVVLGDQSVARAAELPAAILERLRTDVHPRAGAVLELGSKRLESLGPHAPPELEPLYLREFGAQRAQGAR